MKLPTTSALMLFLNSVSASAKITTGGDDHMMHDLLAKVEAFEVTMPRLPTLKPFTMPSSKRRMPRLPTSKPY